MRYKFIEHTADIAFEAYGRNLEELFENCAYAFYEAFVDTSKLKGIEKRVMEVEAEDEDLMLYRFLNELLFLFETQFFAGREVRVRIDDKKAISEIEGGRFGREAVKVEPKAITMHKFGIRMEGDMLVAFVVVDI
jgi:SHS2 domain-containing protein